MSSLAELQEAKAALSKEKDAALAKFRKQSDKLNEQINVAAAAEKLEVQLEGMTPDERAAALKAVS